MTYPALSTLWRFIGTLAVTNVRLGRREGSRGGESGEEGGDDDERFHGGGGGLIGSV
jgi:hypothetical protein